METMPKTPSLMPARSALPALAAALLFGASTPLAKLLVGEVPALLLAGLLYLGSGVGLSAVLAAQWLRAPACGLARQRPSIPRHDIPWLIGAIAFGGVLGPALLMLGLMQASGAGASLLLNVEAC